MFPKNVGPVDRAIRLVVGAVLLPAGLFLLGGLQGSTIGVVAAILGLIGLVSGSTGRCLLYVLFGINTLPKGQAAPAH